MGKINRISTIIINYNTANLVIECIMSLIDQLEKEKDCIIIVDNKSSGDDVKVLREWRRDSFLSEFVTIIESNINGGFSAGNNLGIQAQIAEYYLLTNSDTLFREGAIENLLSFAKNSSAGMIGPQLVWPDDKRQVSCFKFPGRFSEFIGAAQTGVITKILNRYNVPILYPQNQDFDWISFASIMIKRNVIENVGLMDESFFMYFEDVDYCRRVKNANIDIDYCQKSRVVHLIGKSSGLNDKLEMKKSLPPYYYHSRSRYFIKFHGYIGFVSINLFWLAGRVVSLFCEKVLRIERNVTPNKHRDIWKVK